MLRSEKNGYLHSELETVVPSFQESCDLSRQRTTEKAPQFLLNDKKSEFRPTRVGKIPAQLLLVAVWRRVRSAVHQGAHPIVSMEAKRLLRQGILQFFSKDFSWKLRFPQAAFTIGQGSVE
jgi:hypothetical protein